MTFEFAGKQFFAAGLAGACVSTQRVEASQECDGHWKFGLENEESVIVFDDGTMVHYDAEGIGRVYEKDQQ